jgi:two-component system, OmpR family, alkaline phosphatase synthesis response regulator PhoP
MPTKRIILVDDEAYVTKTLAAKLRLAGHEVSVASNGEEGLALVTQNPPDLLITDYQMPFMSGFEMSMKLKQQPATAAVPVLMLTARGHHLTPSELAKTNIRMLLGKPFSARELTAKVEEILADTGAQS